mmetsp:Transcript_44514/g.107260  ORF Transcript_44514/g.107260 Transcript_44514/m.107260 type:complete len:221 (+) Transcript_44514:5491-6153(+)
MLDGIQLLGLLPCRSIDIRILTLSEFFSQQEKVGKWLSRGTIFFISLVTRPRTAGHVGEMRDNRFSSAFFHVHGKVVVQLLESVGRHERLDRRLHLSSRLHHILELSHIDLVSGQFRCTDTHPSVLQCRGGTGSLVRINGQALRDQVLGAVGNVPPELWPKVILSISRSIKDELFIVSIKGQVSTQQQEENYTDTPNITLDIICWPPFQNFRSQISRSPA